MSARLLIGIGVSATLGSAFTALAQHFPLRQLPLLNGLTMALGGLGGGALARRMELAGVSLHAFAGAGMALFVADQALILVGAPLPAALLWACYGALGGTGILGFAALARHFPAHFTGRVTASFNFVIFLLIFCFQAGVGHVLSLWPVADGHYPAQAHRLAWAVLIALQIASAVWYFWPERRRE